MNEPKLRFPEFTGAWEQRKLGDIVPITMGQSPNGNTYSDTPSDYILVQGNADLQNGWVTPRMWTTQVTKKADAGDLIMSVRAPAGAMGKTAYDAVIGRGVAAIKGNEFIYQLLVKMDSDGYWKPLACGSTFESLNSNNIKNANVLIPNTDEQAKIGTCFANLDNLIQSAEKELEGYRELKQGMLQKMFPKKGEKVPEIRFPEFTGDWEQRKLGDVTEVITKGTAPHDKSWVGPVNYIRTESIDKETGLLSQTCATSIEEHEGYLKRSQLKENDVLFSIVGTMGRVGLVKPKDLPANTNQQIAIIRLKEMYPEFVLNALKTPSIDSYVSIETTIGAQPSLSLWQIEKMEIPVPSYREQEKIGVYFNNLDNLITLQQRELDGYKELKKGLLQQMFC